MAGLSYLEPGHAADASHGPCCLAPDISGQVVDVVFDKSVAVVVVAGSAPVAF